MDYFLIFGLVYLFGCMVTAVICSIGDFGHLIYRQEPQNCIEWTVVGMYLNDSLIVLGNPRYIGYRYPIFNKNSGTIVDYYEISKK